MVGGPIGNTKNNKLVKLKKLGIEQHAFEDYLEHLSEGYVRGSWFYVNKEHNFYLIADSMEKYIKENPADFSPIKVKVALNKGYKKWEKVVNNSADGTDQKPNTASLNMLMRNKYGWDKKAEERTIQICCSDVNEAYAKGNIKQPD